MKYPFGVVMAFLVILYLIYPVGAQTINFAYQNGVNYVTAMVAERMGYFAEFDLDVEGRIFTSGPLVSESILSGAAQIGMMGDTPAIIAVSKNLPITILASVAGGPGRNRLMIAKGSGIEDLEDLEGKRIGIAFGTSSHGALYTLANLKGLSIDRMNLINIRPADMVEALATQQVDAVLVWEPTPSLIEATGAGLELMTLECINNVFPTFLLVSNRLLQRDPDIGIRFLKALDKANTFIKENWEEAIIIASEVTGLKKEIVSVAMDYIQYELNLHQGTMDSFHQTAQFLLEYDSISNLPDVERGIDNSYLKAIGK